MPSSKRSSLRAVAQLVDQLVDLTVTLLILRGGSPHQLVLNLTRERALRSLQQMFHDDVSCGQLTDEQRWQIIGAIVAMAIAYALGNDSDSILYQQGLAHARLFTMRRLRWA